LPSSRKHPVWALKHSCQVLHYCAPRHDTFVHKRSMSAFLGAMPVYPTKPYGFFGGPSNLL